MYIVDGGPELRPWRPGLPEAWPHRKIRGRYKERSWCLLLCCSLCGYFSTFHATMAAQQHAVVDASELDAFAVTHLVDSLKDAFALVIPQETISEWSPKLRMAVACAVLGLTWTIGRPSPGQAALGIANADTVPGSHLSIVRRVALPVLCVFGDWGLRHAVTWGCDAFIGSNLIPGANATPHSPHSLPSRAATTRTGGAESAWLSALPAAVKLAQLANFIIFLRSGEYPTLSHRLLRIQVVSDTCPRVCHASVPGMLTCVQSDILPGSHGARDCNGHKRAYPGWCTTSTGHACAGFDTRTRGRAAGSVQPHGHACVPSSVEWVRDLCSALLRLECRRVRSPPSRGPHVEAPQTSDE